MSFEFTTNPHRNSCGSRTYKLLCCPSATQESYNKKRSLTGWPTSTQTSESRRVQAGYLAHGGPASLSHENTTRHDFWTHMGGISLRNSVTITLIIVWLPCRCLEGLRWCRVRTDLVVPRTGSCRIQTIARLLLAELFLYIIPGTHEEAVLWPSAKNPTVSNFQEDEKISLFR